MTRQTSSKDRNSYLDPKEKMIRLIRMSGVACIIFALIIYLNLGDVGGFLGLEPDIRTILASALLFVAFMDIVLVPRLLQMVKPK
jgi:hypothetical protein